MVKASDFGSDTAGSNPAALASLKLLGEIIVARRELNEAILQVYKDFPELETKLGPVEKFMLEECPQALFDFVNEDIWRTEEGLKRLEADAEALGITLPEMPD